MHPENKNPKVKRYFVERLFLKTSTIKTITVTKLHNTAVYVNIFPASSGRPKGVRSKVMVHTVKIKPNTATGKSTFLEISKSFFTF